MSFTILYTGRCLSSSVLNGFEISLMFIVVTILLTSGSSSLNLHLVSPVSGLITIPPLLREFLSYDQRTAASSNLKVPFLIKSAILSIWLKALSIASGVTFGFIMMWRVLICSPLRSITWMMWYPKSLFTTLEILSPFRLNAAAAYALSLIHISEPTRLGMISYAVFCLKQK